MYTLGVTGMANRSFRKVDPARRRRLTLISAGSFFLLVVGVGILVIGWSAFRLLINFHKSVFRGSGQYGTVSGTVVSGPALWNAIAPVPRRAEQRRAGEGGLRRGRGGAEGAGGMDVLLHPVGGQPARPAPDEEGAQQRRPRQ